MNTRKALASAPLFGKDLCVYCGGLADTKDHAPPKCLLREPLPQSSNLITFPACNACNSGFSFAEEVVKAVIALVSDHPDLIRSRQHGGKVDRSLSRNQRLRELIAMHRQQDGTIALAGELHSCFEKVFRKTVQGLYFGLYERVVPESNLLILSIEDQKSVGRDDVATRVRPPALREITDAPLWPEITPNGWMVREPVYFVDLQPLNSDGEGAEPVRKLFRLVRETPVEWVSFQPDVFTFGFVESAEGGAVCILDLWNTLVVAVATPWPGGRGPIRKGRRNPFSRERRP